MSRLPAPPHRLSPLVLGLLFGAAEILVVHVEFRGQAHTISLVEVPLVLALYFCAPAAFIPAHLIGAGLALLLYRRQPAVKLTYNLACFAAEDVLALAVFHTLSSLDPMVPSSWAAVIVAATIAAAAGVVLVTLVISISGGRQTWAQRRQAMTFALAASAISASTAAALAVLRVEQPRAIWLLTAPIAALYVVNRLIVAQRNDRRSLGFLQKSPGLLPDGDPPDQALGQLLEQTRALFQSDVAALIYTPSGDAETAGMMMIGPGSKATALSICPRELIWPEWVHLTGGEHARLIASRRGSGLPSIGGVGINDGIVTPMHVGSRTAGYFLVANRLSAVSRFSSADLLVLTALAQQVSVGVAEGRFELMEHELRVFERQLAFRASHDSLTGLPTRDAFSRQLDSRLRDPSASEGPIAVIVIELDSAEHRSVADGVVLVASERLRHVVRQTDLVGRLDDVILAIMATAHDDEELDNIRDRVTAALTRTIQVDAQRVHLTPRIGIAGPAPQDSADELIDRATLWLAPTST